MVVSYDGSAFAGFQWQAGKTRTVQVSWVEAGCKGAGAGSSATMDAQAGLQGLWPRLFTWQNRGSVSSPCLNYSWKASNLQRTQNYYKPSCQHLVRVAAPPTSPFTVHLKTQWPTMHNHAPRPSWSEPLSACSWGQVVWWALRAQTAARTRTDRCGRNVWAHGVWASPFQACGSLGCMNPWNLLF